MRSKNWMPLCFSELNTALLANFGTASTRGYDLRPGQNNNRYVYGLGKAAAKYKLATAIVDVRYDDYTHRTRLEYTAQIKLLAAFVAFEAYARLMNSGKWYDLSARISQNYTVEAGGIHGCITSTALTDLSNFMQDDKLQRRIRDFQNGNLNEVNAVACALRHGFAHGLYGSRSQFRKASERLYPLLLKSIEDDCNNEKLGISAVPQAK